LNEHLTYLRVIDQVTWYAASWNASLRGFLSRIFGGSENQPLFNLPGVASGLNLLLSAGLLAALAWTAWRAKGSRELQKTWPSAWRSSLCCSSPRWGGLLLMLLLIPPGSLESC